MAVKLLLHQLKVLEKIHNGAVLKGGVGTGKSITALAYYTVHVLGRDTVSNDGSVRPKAEGSTVRRVPVEPQAGGEVPGHSLLGSGQLVPPKRVIVITTAKKRDDKDWEKEAAAFAISSDPSASFEGVTLEVESWNNIGNYVDVTDAWFIFDEQRLVGSGAWVKAFLKIARSNPWIMLSATPGDGWMDYIPIFIANGWYKNRTEFIRRHVVYKNFSKFPKIDRFVDVGHLVKLRNMVLVDMPYARATTRHIRQVIVQHDIEQFKRVWVDRWHIYEDRPLKDVGEMFVVARKLVNSDPSRLGATMQTLEKHPRLIVFYNFDYELYALRQLGESLNIPTAEWNGHKHQQIPETDTWLYLVQYTAGSEGWNCIVTNATAFYSLNYSYKVFEQSQGRIDRLNTPYFDLYYYVFKSGSRIDQLIQKALSQKRNFNEKEIKW